MTKIGSFGTARPPRAVGLTFDYFGQEIRVNEDVSEAVIFHFLATAGDLDTGDNGQAMVAMSSLMRSLVDPEDLDSFMRMAVKNRQTAEDLMVVVSGILEAVGDTPTQQPSDSSDGQSNTEVSSTGGLSSLGIQHRFEAEGRPDLALVVQEVRESRSA